MRVGILGCGYVGLALGERLADAGHDVVGVRRSAAGLKAVENAGLTPIQADLTDREDLSAIPDLDAVVFAASSGGRGAEAAREIYVEGQRTAIEEFGSRDSPPERYLYTSSTGVYGDHGGDWVDEDTELRPTTDKTRVLATAEEVALEVSTDHGLAGTVARLAGIYGPDRYRLERYLAGPVTAGYLNRIHREDAAGAIAFLLEEDLAHDEVVLVVDNEPIDRWAFADWLAAECNAPEPPKQTREERLASGDLSTAAERRLHTSKRCSNATLRGLGYAFEIPTVREGYRPAIEAYLGE